MKTQARCPAGHRSDEGPPRDRRELRLLTLPSPADGITGPSQGAL